MSKIVFDFSSPTCPKAEEAVEVFADTLYEDYVIRRSIKRVVEIVDSKADKVETRVEIYCTFSKRLMQENAYKHCNDLLMEGVSKFEHSDKMMIEMGKLKYLIGKYDEAVEFYHRALKLSRTDNKKELVYNISVNLMLSEKYEEALAKFK